MISNLKYKYRKQNILLCILLLILFIPPVLLFPAYPETVWQDTIYRYITENLHITVGINGPLPFFTVLSNLYTTIFIIFLGSYLFYLLVQKFGLEREFQQEFFKLSFQSVFRPSDQYPWRKIIIFKIILMVCVLTMLCFFIFLHNQAENISFKSYKKETFYLLYHFKLGIILGEIFINLFLILPFFYFLTFMIYLINYLRGLGTGKIISPMPPARKKRKNRQRKRKL